MVTMVKAVMERAPDCSVPKGGLKELVSLVHLGFSFAFIFSAFLALQGIESSLNYREGLGTLSLSLMYGTNFLSSMFIGPPLIKLLTPKWVMCVCFLAHTLFIIAHFWSSAILLMTSGVILGVAFSPAWVANGTYITVLASRYAHKTGKDFAASLQLLNGIFYLVFSLHGIPANIAISTILDVARNDSVCVHHNLTESNTNSQSDQLQNETAGDEYVSSGSHMDCSRIDISICGAAHCPYKETHMEVFDKPKQELLYTLLSCFLALNVIGIILTAFLQADVKTDNSKTSTTRNILSTLKMLRKRDMQLFSVPLFVIFVNESLFYGSYTQAFAGCVHGIDNIGYVALAQATGWIAITAIFTLCANCFSQHRRPILYSAMALNAALALTWLLWQPERDTFWIVLLLSGVHGLVHGVYKIQAGALTSLLFPDEPEAAFSMYNLMFSLASSFTWGLSFILCFHVKMYILLALLVAMATCYGVLERRQSKRTVYVTETR